MRAINFLYTSSKSEVCTQSYGPQSCKSPNFENFGIPTSESWDKMTLGVGLVARHKVRGKVVAFLKSGPW
jgi:hypothetical protein